jgi:hypothetical protein
LPQVLDHGIEHSFRIAKTVDAHRAMVVGYFIQSPAWNVELEAVELRTNPLLNV